MSSEPVESETLKEFQFLEEQGKKLFEALKLENYEKGRHLYGTWITIDEKVDPELKKAFRNQAIISTYRDFIKNGIKSLILRASSPKSAHIYCSMGARVLSEVEVTVNGQVCQLKLLELEFDNPVFRKLTGL
jgi:predicted RNA binding protein with dsRBD fold (UPF0201 family)